MEIRVLFFASVAAKLELRELMLALPQGATVATARDALMERFPALVPFVPNLLFALDEEYVQPSATISNGATLALIPPVSGG